MAHITTDRLRKELEKIRLYSPTCSDDMLTPEGVVFDLLIESLPPAEKKAYDYILESKTPVTSRQVADHFGLVINRVGNILANLRRWGLVDSEAKSGPDGLYYEWRVKE